MNKIDKNRRYVWFRLMGLYETKNFIVDSDINSILLFKLRYDFWIEVYIKGDI